MDPFALLVAVGVAILVAAVAAVGAFALWMLVQLVLRLTPSHRNPPPPAPLPPVDYERYGS